MLKEGKCRFSIGFLRLKVRHKNSAPEDHDPVGASQLLVVFKFTDEPDHHRSTRFTQFNHPSSNPSSGCCASQSGSSRFAIFREGFFLKRKAILSMAFRKVLP